MAIAESAPYAITVIGAPTLSNFTAVGVTQTGADLFVSTSLSGGAIYVIADEAPGVPAHQQIKEGNTAAGTSATASVSVNVVTAGIHGPMRAEPFGQERLVNCWAYHEMDDGVQSEIVGVSFITLANPELAGDPDTLTSFYNPTGITSDEQETEDSEAESAASRSLPQVSARFLREKRRS